MNGSSALACWPRENSEPEIMRQKGFKAFKLFNVQYGDDAILIIEHEGIFGFLSVGFVREFAERNGIGYKIDYLKKTAEVGQDYALDLAILAKKMSSPS